MMKKGIELGSISAPGQTIIESAKDLSYSVTLKNYSGFIN